MRVRYGKPIKVKSMLSSSLSRDISNGGSYALVYKNWGTGADVEFRAFTEADYSHKFFCYTEFELAANNFTYTGFAAQGTSESTYKPNNYSLCSINKPTANAVSLYVYGTLQSPITVKTRFMIDLTEIGLDNLTAQEFYNKYNKYFPLIATGEEITIDDKAGQISLGPKLPLEYQQVEYIESPDSQYIDTGKTVNSTCIISFDFQYASIIGGYNRIFGARNGNGNGLLNIRSTNTDGGNFYLENRNTSWADTAVDTNKHSIVMNAVTNKMIFDGIEKLSNFGINDNTEGTMWLFGTNQGGSTSNVRFFNYKLIKNGQLEQNLVPCYRKSDNVIGMYDLVGKQFYTNQGTGIFLKGNDVNNTISCKVAGGSSDIYYGYNQLVKNGNFVDSSIWSNTEGTTKAVSNNIMTLTATSLSQYDFAIYQNIGDLKANDKYMILFDAKTNSSSNKTINIYLTAGYVSQSETLLPNVWNSIGKIFSYSTDKTSVTAYFGKIGGLSGLWANDDIIYFKNINIINLTDWYGAGKEPTTVAEFKEKFAKEYYGFCPTPVRLTRYQIENEPTYGYNQIANINRSTATIRGISFVNNGNNTLTITGTSQKSDNISIGNMEIVEGHKYYGFTNVISGTLSASTYWIKWVSASYGKDIGEGVLFTATSSANPAYCSFYVEGSNIDINAKIQMMLIDLTDWYGEGDEPATIEEFRATFPNKHYPYSKKRLLNKYMINKLEN